MFGNFMVNLYLNNGFNGWKPGKPGRILDLASVGVWGTICCVHFKQRVARKLHRIILLQFGVVTFRFNFGKTRKPIIFNIFGPSESVHDSQNQLCLIKGPPNYVFQLIQEKYQIRFGTYNFEESQNLGKRHSGGGNNACREILTIGLISS